MQTPRCSMSSSVMPRRDGWSWSRTILDRPFLARSVASSMTSSPISPYTVSGQLVFAHRAALALKRTHHGQMGPTLFLCAARLYLGAAGRRRVARFLGRAGFVTGRVHPDFNRYAAPPDVARDLRRLGGGGRWLSSDLSHYVRQRSAPVPRLPAGALWRMYDYASHPQS